MPAHFLQKVDGHEIYSRNYVLIFHYNEYIVDIVVNCNISIMADMSVPKVAAEVARQLQRFHQVEVPGSKEPQLWNDIFKFFHKGLKLLFLSAFTVSF